MKNTIKSVSLTIAALGLLGIYQNAQAGNTAQQTVTFEVKAINELTVSGNPGALVVDTATAGGAPVVESDSSTTYAITTTETGQKITAQLDTDMPASTTLKVNLAAPSGSGSSAGDVTLSSTGADVVTGISTLNESGLGITYKFSAGSAAGVLSSDTRTVTLTVL